MATILIEQTSDSPDNGTGPHKRTASAAAYCYVGTFLLTSPALCHRRHTGPIIALSKACLGLEQLRFDDDRTDDLILLLLRLELAPCILLEH